MKYSHLCIALAVLTLSIATLVLLSTQTPPAAPAVNEPMLAKAKALRAETEQKIHAEWMRCADKVADVVLRRKKNARAFAEDVTGLGATWHLLDMESFTRQKFAEHFFSEQQLCEELRQCIRETERAVHDLEDELALQLEQCDLPDSQLPQFTPKALGPDIIYLQRLSTGKYLARCSQTSLSLAMGMAIKQATACLLRTLATRSAIATTALSSSWCSFGLSLAAGALIDKVLTSIFDPADEVETEILSQLDAMALQLKDDFLASLPSDTH